MLLSVLLLLIAYLAYTNISTYIPTYDPYTIYMRIYIWSITVYIVCLSSVTGRAMLSNKSGLYSLTVLDLSNNLFTGELPSEIFALPRIQYVAIREGEPSYTISRCKI